MSIQHAVLRFDVSVEHTSLVKIDHCQKSLREVVPSKGLREGADTGEEMGRREGGGRDGEEGGGRGEGRDGEEGGEGGMQ